MVAVVATQPEGIANIRQVKKMNVRDSRDAENYYNTEVMPFQNILHIDDDADDHEIFFSALRKINHAINYNALSNAREALTSLMAKELTPDVIFLDLNMPEMSGQQFLLEMKKSESLRHIPVIILSASSHIGLMELAKELGARNFITKPNSFDKLVQILSSILD
jgi:CheY-like chemotaxis protein